MNYDIETSPEASFLKIKGFNIMTVSESELFSGFIVYRDDTNADENGDPIYDPQYLIQKYEGFNIFKDKREFEIVYFPDGKINSKDTEKFYARDMEHSMKQIIKHIGVHDERQNTGTQNNS